MVDEPIKKTILIVEDEVPLKTALNDKLSREGFNVLVAKDGEEGLQIAVINHPDLILLDLIMPKMDGLSMMKKLRAESDWGKRVPIIILTNLSPDEEKINKGITEDMPAYYLVKTNLGVSDVIEKVKERINRV